MSSTAQAQSDSLNKSRLKTVAWAGSALYAGTMTGLYFVWYKDGIQGKFRFFNDNAQWKQVDKVGHFYSAYHFSRASAEAFRWAGLKEKKAMFWGSLSGVILMTPIEILDGFSEEYGASWGDFLANTSGSALLYGQYLLWDEIRIKPKFSFFPSPFAEQRPSILGAGLQEELIKDYNAQTYWLSLDLDRFMPNAKFPKWLNLGVGYGAQGMLYAQDQENLAMTGNRAFRQYYLGPDFDLSQIPARRKFYKILLFMLDMIHLPAPALEFNRSDGLRFHFLFF